MSSKINSHDIEDKSISNNKLENDYLDLINEVNNKIDNINPQDDRILSTIDGEFVINGNGYLKDNTNFNRLEFDSNKTNNSFGSFKVPVNNGYSAYSDLIPIDNTKNYLFSMDAITQNAQATLFGRIEYLDANGNSLGDSGYVAAHANIPPSDSWQTYSATIAASNRPSMTTQIKIHWLFNHLAVDDYIWITNVKFKAIEYATISYVEEVEAKIPIITSGTTDLTAGVSELPDSHVYLVYE